MQLYRFAELVVPDTFQARRGHVRPFQEPLLADWLGNTFARRFLHHFPLRILGSEQRVAPRFLFAASHLLMPGDMFIREIADGCQQHKRQHNAYQEETHLEHATPIHEQRCENGLHAVCQCDTAREQCEPERFSGRERRLVFHPHTCHIEGQGEQEHGENEMVGNKDGEHDVGERKRHCRKQTTFPQAHLKDMTENPQQEDERIKCREQQRNGYHKLHAVQSRPEIQPVVQHMEGEEHEHQQRMAENDGVECAPAAGDDVKE